MGPGATFNPPRLTSMDDAEAQLKILLTRPYQEALLTPISPGTQAGERTKFASVFRVEVVRLEILRLWREQRLWIKPDPVTLRDTVAALLDIVFRRYAPNINSEVAIRRQLNELLALPYNRDLLDELLPIQADRPPPRKPLACRYGNAFLIPSVKMHVRLKSEQLWMWARPDPIKIRTAADELAQFLGNQHLPAKRKQLADQAAQIKTHLHQILDQRYRPAELPLLVYSEPPEVSPPDPCPYSHLLRMDSVRPHVLAAWLSLELRPQTSVDERKRIKNNLLRLAMRPYADDLFGANVARYTTASGRRSEWESKRQEVARALCKADLIPVRALLNTKWQRELKPAGSTFHVPILTFLEELYQHAWADSRRHHGPVWEATGQSHPARKAATCAAILSLLAEKRRSAERPDASASVTLNELVFAISGSKGGKRYQQIKELAQGLGKLGLIRCDDVGPIQARQTGSRYRIALVRKKVKYLHGSIRRQERTELDST